MRFFGNGRATQPSQKSDNSRAGAPSIEALIWMPVYALCIAATTCGTFAMYEQARMWDLVRVSARQISLGHMTAQDAQTYIRDQLTNPAHYTILLDEGSRPGDVVSAELRVKTRDLVPFAGDLVAVFFARGEVSARIAMVREG